MKNKIKNVLIFVLILLADIMIVGSIYYKNNYANQNFDEIVFYLFNGLKNTSIDVINSVILSCIVPLIILMLITWLPITRFIKLKYFNVIKNHKVIYITILSIISITLLIFNFKIYEYVYFKFAKTKIYDEEYINGENVKITFPEEKRNLIIIIAESMENTICSEKSGGGWRYSLIPELEQLLKQNISFSNTEQIGGATQVTGTTFTAGAMVAITSGIPLKIDNHNTYKGTGNYLEAVYSLGDVLHKEGYNLEIMMGSDGTFGGRTQYFTTNGNYKIFDVNYAIEIGKMKEEEKVWWGFEDDRLFAWSKEEIINLANQDEPFNYIMLTADTHFIDGYLSKNAENKFETQYENVFAYSSKSIYEFVEWIKKQEFYENTTIVIVGDHLGMQDEFYNKNMTKGYKRTIYNVIINSSIAANNTKNRQFANMDMFPTILASIGVKIEGERLGLGTNLFSNRPTIMEELGKKYVSRELKKKSEFYNHQLLREDYYLQKNLNTN